MQYLERMEGGQVFDVGFLGDPNQPTTEFAFELATVGIWKHIVALQIGVILLLQIDKKIIRLLINWYFSPLISASNAES